MARLSSFLSHLCYFLSRARRGKEWQDRGFLSAFQANHSFRVHLFVSVYPVSRMTRRLRAVAVSLRNVVPVILEHKHEHNQLEEELKKMRCVGLVERPWGLKNKDIVRELIAMERPNMFEGTIQDWPEEWTAKVWREVYKFPTGGSGIASQMDTYSDGEFLHVVDPKDGYPIRDCRDARNRRLLEFIMPIIHPYKPTWVMIMIGNMIFGTLDGGRLVD